MTDKQTVSVTKNIGHHSDALMNYKKDKYNNSITISKDISTIKNVNANTTPESATVVIKTQKDNTLQKQIAIIAERVQEEENQIIDGDFGDENVSLDNCYPLKTEISSIKNATFTTRSPLQFLQDDTNIKPLLQNYSKFNFLTPSARSKKFKYEVMCTNCGRMINGDLVGIY